MEIARQGDAEALVGLEDNLGAHQPAAGVVRRFGIGVLIQCQRRHAPPARPRHGSADQIGAVFIQRPAGIVDPGLVLHGIEPVRRHHAVGDVMGPRVGIDAARCGSRPYGPGASVFRHDAIPTADRMLGGYQSEQCPQEAEGYEPHQAFHGTRLLTTGSAAGPAFSHRVSRALRSRRAFPKALCPRCC